VGHAQAKLGALAVLEAEHVVAHDGPAAALDPGVLGEDAGEQEFLADFVHFVADDGDDLVEGTLSEEEVVVEAGADLADIAGANEELVAGHFGVRRGLAKGGNEELRPTMHRNGLACFPVRNPDAKR